MHAVLETPEGVLMDAQVTFDRDPKTKIGQHAMSRSFWTSILYIQAASLMPTLVVLISGLLFTILRPGSSLPTPNYPTVSTISFAVRLAK